MHDDMKKKMAEGVKNAMAAALAKKKQDANKAPPIVSAASAAGK